MINNRNKSTVRGMKWTADGQRICIIYEDGAVIVGSVDGNRLWGKELKTQLCNVEWSPDGRNIIFCTLQCEVHIYDSIGNFISKLPLFCLDDSSAETSLVGIDWYDGSEGLQDTNQPTLAIGLQNGRLQLMRHEADDAPVLIDTGLVATNLQWNTDGSVLALAGNFGGGGGAGREISMVQFYSPLGQLLRTLKVPGSGIHALSWEGGSLRVALAVDSYIYFANIRPDYRWGYFGDTLVCAYSQPERTDSTVLFWNIRTEERSIKFFQQLLSIRASSETCVLATHTDDNSGQYVLILCNVIGSPLDAKYIDFEPQHLLITPHHVIAASGSFIYVWQYRTLMSKLTSVDLGTGSLRRREGRERVFHVDDTASLASNIDPAVVLQGREPSQDAIIALGASHNVLLVARESGLMHRYSLPHISLDHTYTLRCRPQAILLNCDSSRASIIDTNGVLCFFDTGEDTSGGGEVTMTPSTGAEGSSRFERKDVWDMRWADDDPDLFALMEKTRMYVFRGLVAEEPVLSSAYICSFSSLEIQAVLLDQLMREPEAPSKEYLLRFETKALREARELLDRGTSLSEAATYIEENPNPRLWRLLAEAALSKLDFVTADQAFVQNSDYMGVQFVKRLRLLDDVKKQAAEVAAYFGNFDEAERAYKDLDRRDLSLQLRANIGDWFKVVQLIQQGGGDDAMLETAWNRIGDYFYERQKVAKAAQYYAQAKNMEALIKCYCFLEDWAGLEKSTAAMNEGSPILHQVAEYFAGVGMSDEAVAAFIKAGHTKVAIESCVKSHHWEAAIRLAESHNYPETHKLLAQYAKELLVCGQPLHAVELFRKAKQFTEAAKLLSKLGAEVGASRMHPLRAKKLFVMAALEVERMRKSMLTAQTIEGSTQTAAQTLDSLVEQDKATGGDKWLDASWKGAEAFHYLLLAQHQLYNGYPADAMRTALRLRQYESLLPPDEIYSLIALTAFYSKFFGQCSNAFIKLKSLPVGEQRATRISKLALTIFSRYTPTDPATRRNSCHNCGAPVKEWDARCADCGTAFACCIASGRSLLDPAQIVACRTCKHQFYEAEQQTRRNCPLCHTSLQMGIQSSSTAAFNEPSSWPRP